MGCVVRPREALSREELDALWEAARAGPVHQDAGRHPDLRACGACRIRHERCSGCGYAIGDCPDEDDVIRCCIRMEGPLRPVRLLVIRRD